MERPPLDALLDPLDADAMILVVEDVPLLRLAAEALVGVVRGAKPQIVDDGCEAVAAVLEIEYDLILMDLEMPVLDGVAAVRLIRLVEFAARRGRRAPIVAYTGSAETVDRAALLAAGFDGVLAKPATPEQMAACLDRWCRRTTARDVARAARVEAVIPSMAEAVSMASAAASLQALRVAAQNPARQGPTSPAVQGARTEVENSVEHSLARSRACIAESVAALRRFGDLAEPATVGCRARMSPVPARRSGRPQDTGQATVLRCLALLAGTV